MELTILCKVIDNFGDIGVAWRMAKRFVDLTKKDNPVKDLDSKINLLEEHFNMKYNEEQKEAIRESYLKNFLIIV